MDGPSTKLLPRVRFRQFFFRGLTILLPTVLTIWILMAAYQFVQGYIASPINRGVKTLVIDLTPWPAVTRVEVADRVKEVNASPSARDAYRAAGESQAWMIANTRMAKLNRWWNQYAVALDLIGLFIAIALIYIAGLLLGSFIGRRLYKRGEDLINRLPLVRRVYPAVKQVTDFFMGENQQHTFNRVVAVQYPRKGMWSVGLVTGGTMTSVEKQAGEECLTVFIPTAPTPFTGYVVILPRADAIDLPMSIEDVMKFCVSGGVLIPSSQLPDDDRRGEREMSDVECLISDVKGEKTAG